MFYITNRIWASHPAEHLGGLGALAPLWSLAIEEQFYLLWPATFVVLLRWRAKPVHISAILIVLTIASICQRLFLWQAVHPTRAHFGTDSHADPILIGCLLALVVHTVSEQVWTLVRPWLAAAIPFVMAVVLVSIVLTEPGRYPPTMAAICAAMLILSVTVAHARLSLTIFECRVLVWLGKISYGLYLWHSVSSLYLEKHGLVESTIASFFIALALALASYYIVERPALKFKDRLSGAGAVPQKSWSLAGIFKQLSYPVEQGRRKSQVPNRAIQSKQF